MYQRTFSHNEMTLPGLTGANIPLERNLNSGMNERKNLEKAQKKAYVPLIRWLKGNFSEAFINWIHVKALRLFTESVLRYGLPANFLVCLHMYLEFKNFGWQPYSPKVF